MRITPTPAQIITTRPEGFRRFSQSAQQSLEKLQLLTCCRWVGLSFDIPVFLRILRGQGSCLQGPGQIPGKAQSIVKIRQYRTGKSSWLRAAGDFFPSLAPDLRIGGSLPNGQAMGKQQLPAPASAPAHHHHHRRRHHHHHQHRHCLECTPASAPHNTKDPSDKP